MMIQFIQFIGINLYYVKYLSHIYIFKHIKFLPFFMSHSMYHTLCAKMSSFQLLLVYLLVIKIDT